VCGGELKELEWGVGGGARESAAMEANAGLVAGSHNRNELVVIPGEGVCLQILHHPPFR
jgi:hypothetical protein